MSYDPSTRIKSSRSHVRRDSGWGDQGLSAVGKQGSSGGFQDLQCLTLQVFGLFWGAIVLFRSFLRWNGMEASQDIIWRVAAYEQFGDSKAV